MMEKKRYLLLAFERAEPLQAEEAKNLAYEALFSLLGEAGAAKARITWKDFDEKEQKGVLKCSTGMLDKVVAALALKRYWKGGDVAIRVQRVSGEIGKIWSGQRPPRLSKTAARAG